MVGDAMQGIRKCAQTHLDRLLEVRKDWRKVPDRRQSLSTFNEQLCQLNERFEAMLAGDQASIRTTQLDRMLKEIDPFQRQWLVWTLPIQSADVVLYSFWSKFASAHRFAEFKEAEAELELDLQKRVCDVMRSFANIYVINMVYRRSNASATHKVLQLEASQLLLSRVLTIMQSVNVVLREEDAIELLVPIFRCQDLVISATLHIWHGSHSRPFCDSW